MIAKPFRILARLPLIVLLAGLNASSILIPGGFAADGGEGKGVPKIVDGTVVPAGKYPWAAAIVERDEPNPFDGQFCGGTLIHPYWVLTAAHCVDNTEPSEVDVVFGASDLRIPFGTDRVGAVDIIVHPDYNRSALDYDCALILLERPPRFPITPLPLLDDPALPAAGTMAVSIGWGDTVGNGSSPSPELREVTLPIVATSTAQDFYGFDLTPRMIFAGFAAGGQSACYGDSGSPLFISDGAGGWLLAGVTSFGRGDLNCGDPNNFGGYARVTEFVPWVKAYLFPNLFEWEQIHGEIGMAPVSDGDALDEWAEFALQTDPETNSSSLAPQPVLAEVGGSTYPALEFRRISGASEVDYVVEHHGPDGPWAQLDPAVFRVGTPEAVDGEPGVVLERVRGPEPVTGTPVSLFRLRLDRADRYVARARDLPFPGFAFAGLSALEPTGDGGSYVKTFDLGMFPSGHVVNVTARSSDFDAQLDVVDAATGDIIASDEGDSAGGADDFVMFTTVAGIRYHVAVSSEIPGGTGDFLLSAFDNHSGLTATVPQDLGGALNSADEAIPEWLPQYVFFKEDYGLVNVPAGTHVHVRLIAFSLDPYLYLINRESGQIIQEDDDSAEGGETDAHFTFVTRQFPPIMLRVSSWAPEDTGTYSLRLALGSTLPLGQQVSSNLLSSDTIVPGSGGNLLRESHHLTGLTAGQSVTLTMSGRRVDSYIFVVDGQTGQILYSADNTATGEDETLTFTPQAGRDYIAWAATWANDDGTYTLRADPN